MGFSYFMIVGKGDHPIYETEFSDTRQAQDNSQLKQFVMHAALDIVDELMWTTGAFYLKTVDRFNDCLISAYVTPGCIKFLMMHFDTIRHEDNVRVFFSEVYDLYLKTLLNPFYEFNSPIVSPVFDARVKALLRRHF
eukprot:NODE_4940_length_740_cov_34.662808_g4584_i0.p2 GENE.NODE_4940_length_740_cov_34.662808_g4584_i0~~NODE_4940_length_740_cov_34.662808_g4584_i0.p2  ORF type:complete len:137 (+),score=33.37 NODE_4940_length_740_cov_34.662808_g4584_i0:169-579(+)